MELKERLRNALKVTASEFNCALDCFDPSPGRVNTYPERMLSYYYIQALVRALPHTDVFLEIPVTGKSGRGRDNHIDALIFNDHEVVVAEFKVAWAPSHWVDLARDFDRLRGRRVAQEIRRGFTDNRRRRPFVFPGADCWYPERANAWKSGLPAGRWILPKPLLAARRDYLRIYPDKGSDFDGYYFTWALIDYDEMAAYQIAQP